MADNYKQIFTNIYLRYRPDKVGEVDGLLKRFAGREEEMMYKIYIKYGPPETQATAREKLDRYYKEKAALAALADSQGDLPIPGRKRKRSRVRRIAVVVIALALVGGLTYAGWRLSQGDWDFSLVGEVPPEPLPPAQFVLANAVYARTQCENGEKTDEFLKYGQSLLNYSESGDCFLKKGDTTGGPFYFPARYFVPEEKFREIDAIFGNEAARSQIRHSYEKRALRVWYRQNGIVGDLSPEWRDSIAGKGKNPEVWQIFAESEPSASNAWARGNFHDKTSSDPFDKNPADLACIITRLKDKSKQKLLFFIFDIHGNATTLESFDLSPYSGRLIREFPNEDDRWNKFISNVHEIPAFYKGILLDHPSEEEKDYLLLWKNDRFTILEELPENRFRIPGLPPFF